MLRRVVVVQARTSSTRLPGKVLLDLCGRPMLAQQLRRLRALQRADEIVLATTTNDGDDALVRLAQAEGVRWFRGSEHDVLGRYLGAAREARADVVVRVTSDCPLLDPWETDRVIAALLDPAVPCDYAANIVERTLPRGLDTEALFRDVLERVGRLGVSAAAREHVTWFLVRERPDLFVLRSVTAPRDDSDLRWTVDTPEDLELCRRLYEALGLGDRVAPYAEVVAWLRAHPEVARLNAQVAQKTS
jgi:spore coat polysaccharide biosynthesis protein SpsF